MTTPCAPRPDRMVFVTSNVSVSITEIVVLGALGRPLVRGEQVPAVGREAPLHRLLPDLDPVHLAVRSRVDHAHRRLTGIGDEHPSPVRAGLHPVREIADPDRRDRLHRLCVDRRHRAGFAVRGVGGGAVGGHNDVSGPQK